MNARDIYNTWCSRTDLTDSERAELAQMANDELAITKAFGAKLHFGTAGLRGIMGLGPNCLNRFTIAWATAGIAPLHAQPPRFWQATASTCYFGKRRPPHRFFRGACVIFRQWQGL